MTKNRTLWGIFLANGVVRIWVALHSVFTGDEYAVYSAAARFYLTGRPATTGARVVYSGTVLPGMFQDLVAGLPLFLTGGWPWLTVVLIALLQTGGAWLLWDAYRRLFPRMDSRALAVFLAFAPWTLLYSGFVNTSYFAPLCILVFWGWVRVLLDGSRRAAIALGFGLTAAIQFNLAATFLFAWVILSFAVFWFGPFKKKIRAAVASASLGLGLGALGMVPYLIERLLAPAATGAPRSLLANLHFDWQHVQDLYKVFFRFLSFPTGETTRFLGMARGFGGALEKMWADPFLLLTGIPTLLAALVLVALGLRFFARKPLWRNLVGVRWGIPEAIAFGPLLMMALFMFSIKEPSAHALLPFLPLSFYPLLTEWPKGFRAWFLPAVSGVGLVFSVAGYVESYRPNLLDVQSAARCAIAREQGRECSLQGIADFSTVDPAWIQALKVTVNRDKGTTE